MEAILWCAFWVPVTLWVTERWSTRAVRRDARLDARSIDRWNRAGKQLR